MISFKIFSGVSAATSSISVPPSVDAMTMFRELARSSSTDRYSSVAMSMPCSM